MQTKAAVWERRKPSKVLLSAAHAQSRRGQRQRLLNTTDQARLSLPETNVPNNLAMDGTRHAVLQLKVHLGDSVVGKDRGVRDITCFVSIKLSVSNKNQADVRIAADSTMLRMVNRLMALSLGVHREQLEQRMGLTWPRPFLLRPLRKY